MVWQCFELYGDEQLLATIDADCTAHVWLAAEYGRSLQTLFSRADPVTQTHGGNNSPRLLRVFTRQRNSPDANRQYLLRTSHSAPAG